MTSLTTEAPRPDPSPAEAPYRPGPHRVALAAAVFTLPLLFVGGSVTTYGVGLAVPDWPSTFGINMFLYDFWNAPFGVRVEHTHRLYGAAVGLATVFLAVWFLAFERRGFMKTLGVVALVVVIVQGILGGTRVTQVSTALAAVHGCLGQAFFGLMVALCVLTGKRWRDPAAAVPDVERFRRSSAVMLGLVYVQVVVGAWFRHFHTIESLAVHVTIAAVVLGFAAWLVFRVTRRRAEFPVLQPSARALGATVAVQIAFGVLALGLMLPLGGNPRPPTFWQAVLRTAHQTNGALLLAASVVLTLRTFRHFSPERSARLSRPEQAPRIREAIA
jgi:cytochrome c oxidase assembly protein subunit 15